jgi:ABC-type polysaccharide/polyol phosphate transport system ATPase subunit
MGITAKLCNKVLWLEHGTIRQLGTMEDVLQAYHDAHVASASSPLTVG